MNEALLNVFERTESPKQIRKEGFVPGIVYGREFEKSIPIKLNLIELKKVLKQYGEDAKITFKFGENTKKGIIKEIQKEPVSNKIIHIDIQAINDKDRIKMKVPVIFNGKDVVEKNGFLLEVYVPEIEVFGESSLLPDSFTVDVSNKDHGDKVTVRDLVVDSRVRILNDANETIAAVTIPKYTEPEEETTEAAPAAETAEAQTPAEEKAE